MADGTPDDYECSDPVDASDSTQVGCAATGFGRATTRSPGGGGTVPKAIGALKPKRRPPQVSEHRSATEADVTRKPDGTPLPRTKAEFQGLFRKPEPKVLAAAKDYLTWVTQEGSKDKGKELLKGALDRGDALLGAAGHWLPAVEALRFTWEVELDRGHSAGILGQEWDKHVSPDLLQYLRTQVVEGAQVRQDTEGQERVRAKPHSTSMGSPGAILDKLWRKGACLGRKLLCRANRPELGKKGDDFPGIEECPNGAVPKQNPDRTISDEVRAIWDLRINNADGHVLNHPPALTPRHKELARGIIWWEVRLPGIVALMVKLDVAGAFTLVWLRPCDCGKVSTEIGAEEWGLGKDDAVAAISLTLEFGGCGSPGEWVPWSWGLKEAHSHVYPEDPAWHGKECFSSSYLVDDQSIIEPGIGRRP